MGRSAVNLYPLALLTLSVPGPKICLHLLSVGQIRGSLSSQNTQVWLLMGLCFNPLCCVS